MAMQAADKLADFFERCDREPDYWQQLSRGGIERVQARYTWERYAERMMTLSRIYGFWKYVTNLDRDETRRYLEMFTRCSSARWPHERRTCTKL
jgi:sucrose synthase